MLEKRIFLSCENTIYLEHTKIPIVIWASECGYPLSKIEGGPLGGNQYLPMSDIMAWTL